MRTITTWSDLLHPGDAPSFFDRRPLPPFHASETGFSSSNAWWLAELCRLIYRHDVEEDATPLSPRRSEFLARVGLRQRAFFQSARTGTQGFLVESTTPPLFAALVFRGTEQEPDDFESDLKTAPKRMGNGAIEVHTGFLEALDSVWNDQIAPELEKVNLPIFYTGHSLGAALATLAVARKRPAAAYTFGSPRVGNEPFAVSLAGVPIFRVVDDADVITEVPPELLGFRHVGEVHALTPPLVSGFRFDPFAWFRPPKPLADHAPINYVDRISAGA